MNYITIFAFVTVLRVNWIPAVAETNLARERSHNGFPDKKKKKKKKKEEEVKIGEVKGKKR